MNPQPTRFASAFRLAAIAPCAVITVITVIAVIAASTVFASPLAAGERSHRSSPDEGERMERFAEHHAERLTRALDLTAAQQTTLARLQDDLEATVRPLAAEMRAAHESLRTLLDAASPDPLAVGTQAIAIDSARDRMRAAHEKFEDDFAATLTEAQRTTFLALQEMRPDGERPGRHLRGGRSRH
jgi:Spy/CpxP family protein refolding chaperone